MTDMSAGDMTDEQERRGLAQSPATPEQGGAGTRGGYMIARPGGGNP